MASLPDKTYYPRLDPITKQVVDYTAWDYYKPEYDSKTSDVNLYYRGLIEDMQARHLKALEVERLRVKTCENNMQTMHVELQTMINEYKNKMEAAQHELHLLREENGQLKSLLTECTRRVDAKNRELNDLRALLGERDARIEELLRKLHFAEENANKRDLEELVERLRDEIDFLKKKFNSQIEDWEDQLRQKDRIIAELRERLARAENRDPKVYVDNDKVFELRRKIEQLLAEIDDKNLIIEELRRARAQNNREFIQEAPKVLRVKDPPMKEIRYEKDPYLIEQNQRLSKELEEAINQEQAAKMDLKEKIQEIRDLNNIIAELKARPPKVVYKEKIVTKIVDKPTRIGPALEILMDRYKSYNDDRCRRLGLNMMYYFRLFRHYRKLAMERKEKVMINQKLEVIDGTFDVWKFMRQAIVGWLLDVFVRSTDRAHVRKMNSFILFRVNMEEIKEHGNDQNIMIVSVYARLKNLIYDDIPKIIWEKKYQLPEQIPKEKLLQFEPEDNINEWVEDTLFCVILRKRYDKKGGLDKNILFLFRLLAILYRITYPIKGDPLKIDDDLLVVLESKIVNAAMLYFEQPLMKTEQANEKKLKYVKKQTRWT